MNELIHPAFSEHFYRFSTFDNKRTACEHIALKPTWVWSRLIDLHERLDIRSLHIFLSSLPSRHHNTFTPETISEYTMILRSKFIRLLFLKIQNNADMESMTGNETANSSSDLYNTLLNLRFEKLLEETPSIFLNQVSGMLDEDFKENYSEAFKRQTLFYLEDTPFLMCLILLFGTMRIDSGHYFYKFESLSYFAEYKEDSLDIEQALDIEQGKEILFTRFLDGVDSNITNQANKGINKALKAVSFLYGQSKTLNYLLDFYINGSIYELHGGDEYNDIRLPHSIKRTSYPGKKPPLYVEGDYYLVPAGSAIGINNMVGASKILMKYKAFFDEKDLNFLVNKKKYLGEETVIKAKHSFSLLKEDTKKAWDYYDANTSFSDCF